MLKKLILLFVGYSLSYYYYYLMQRITKVLTLEELNDKVLIKAYIEDSFKARRTQKDKKLYKNINLIFGKYPEIIKQIISNIQTLGYYKDYFHILKHSQNARLDTYLYNIITKKLRDDLKNLELGKDISTLGKYLPREGFGADKKRNFIDTFNELFFFKNEDQFVTKWLCRKVPFGKINDKFSARRLYRKMKTELNEKIGTIESRLCTKTLDKIEYEKVAPRALKKYTPKLLASEITKVNFEAFILGKLLSMTLDELMKEIIRGNRGPEMIENVWSKNNFCKTYSLDKIISDSVCIIDLSKDIYETNSAYFAVGIALLVDQHSKVEKNVIIGSETIELQGSIVEKTAHILRHVGPCNIDIQSVSNRASNVIVVTPKQINAQDFANITHIKTLEHGFHIFPPNAAPITRHVVHVNKEIVKRNIKFLTNNSHELLDKRSPIIFIFCVVMLLSILHLINRFNIVL
uniref:Uncharacterized protein n=1 Tax=viral metagenome TaxID=1070528 RepID=A0A6C0C8C9_9ZZZZ